MPARASIGQCMTIVRLGSWQSATVNVVEPMVIGKVGSCARRTLCQCCRDALAGFALLNTHGRNMSKITMSEPADADTLPAYRSARCWLACRQCLAASSVLRCLLPTGTLARDPLRLDQNPSLGLRSEGWHCSCVSIRRACAWKAPRGSSRLAASTREPVPLGTFLQDRRL